MTERKCACNKLFSILVRGPNIENFEKKFYRQCELGCGPQHREIGFPISTDNASWGGTTK
ncbi:nitrogen fixation protein NifR [Staphylococcus aureus]|nr:nitrogen fixation protein NifR [Staphylococcus aureus]QKK89775.1 nitrogen fixation protein NifR [Staphylococcus aureus]